MNPSPLPFREKEKKIFSSLVRVEGFYNFRETPPPLKRKRRKLEYFFSIYGDPPPPSEKKKMKIFSTLLFSVVRIEEEYFF